MRQGKIKIMNDLKVISEIENLILNYIHKKINDQKKEYEKFIFEIKVHNISMYDTYDKLKEFESKHLDELRSIYTFPITQHSMYGKENLYLEFAFNSIRCQYMTDEEIKELAKNNRVYEDGPILITYHEFEKGTGLNTNSVKNYLQILQSKGMILRQRTIGGYSYDIPG